MYIKVVLVIFSAYIYMRGYEGSFFGGGVVASTEYLAPSSFGQFPHGVTGTPDRRKRAPVDSGQLPSVQEWELRPLAPQEVEMFGPAPAGQQSCSQGFGIRR